MAPRIFGTLDPFFEDGPVLGRKVANQGFLAALLRADPFDAYHFFPADQAQAESLAARLARDFPGVEVQVRHRLELGRAISAADYHVFHLSDCINLPAHLARLRNARARNLFPITAPVHSLSYAEYAQAMALHLWPGTTPRDCIVATSGAGEAVVRTYFQVLRERLGLDPVGFPEPSIRRIPLGVDPELFAEPTSDTRSAARARTGLTPDKATLLAFGRIHHASKMDFLPLLRAMQRVFSSEGGEPLDPASVRLVLAGGVEPGDQLPDTLADMAGRLGLELRVVPGPDEALKADLFLAADIFVSLADNPQETFGLSLLEAQLAGLPVIASDYDGYRDVVDSGVTGLLVPTMGPAPRSDVAPEVDLMAPLLYGNQYHLLLSQQVSVSVPVVARALRELLADPGRREAMGRAGRQRVLDRFTWDSVVQRHVQLWEELNGLPVERTPEQLAAPHPLHVDFGRTFAAHATSLLGPETMLVQGALGWAFAHNKDFPMLYPGVAHLLDPEALRLACFLARRPISAADLEAGLLDKAKGLDADTARFVILWCLKHDLLEQERA